MNSLLACHTIPELSRPAAVWRVTSVPFTPVTPGWYVQRLADAPQRTEANVLSTFHERPLTGTDVSDSFGSKHFRLLGVGVCLQVEPPGRLAVTSRGKRQADSSSRKRFCPNRGEHASGTHDCADRCPLRIGNSYRAVTVPAIMGAHHKMKRLACISIHAPLNRQHSHMPRSARCQAWSIV